jgi:outer membrane protein TolC
MRILLCLLLTASYIPVQAQKAPQASDRPWLQSDSVARTLNVAQEVELDPVRIYSLGELIDIAESRNPFTREAWSQARVQAASLGIARSELYPTLSALAIGRTFQEPVLLYENFHLQDFGLFKSMLMLHYTLFDFGARGSNIDAGKAKLIAANLHFNDAHLQVIHQVMTAYFGLQNATGLYQAAMVTLNDAKAVEQAARDRLMNGLATLPDVLEASAETAKANYELQSAKRNQQIFFGNLATVLTAVPGEPFRVQDFTELSIPDSLGESHNVAANRALMQRPDLLERMAQVRAATAEVQHAKSAYYPTLEFEGNAGWLRAWAQQDQLPSTYGQVKTYNAQVSLRWTLFDGFRRESEIAHAGAERRATEAQVHEQQDKIRNQVWKAWQDAETALEQRKAATAFLQASSESRNAALDAYRLGVRNILDVLSAERQLAQARAADVTARIDVLNAVKDLAFYTGDLLTMHPTGSKP